MASITQVLLPANECCGMFWRVNHGSPEFQKMQPPPTWSGMWQSWQDFMGPCRLPPKRPSANVTPSVAKVLFFHSL